MFPTMHQATPDISYHPSLLAAAGSYAVWRGTPPSPPRPIHSLGRGTIPAALASSTPPKYNPKSSFRNDSAADVLGAGAMGQGDRHIQCVKARARRGHLQSEDNSRGAAHA